MRLADFLDKGASLGPDRPCLTTGDDSMSYAEVVELSLRVAASLAGCGVSPGDKVAILSGNDPVAFSCVFGISRAAAVWCPINPRNEATEDRELLELFDCVALIFQSSFAPLVLSIKAELPKLTTLICLDRPFRWAYRWEDFLALGTSVTSDVPAEVTTPVDDVAMIAGTGGTTDRPNGVMLTGANLETMTALTLLGYPFEDRPTYLALAPLIDAAGVLCFPILVLGGEIVIMRTPDVGEFLTLLEDHEVTHTFLPPPLIYMVLGHPELDLTDLSSLQCFWYGAAPMSAARLEEALTRIGPVMAQLFGQTEAPMMISMMPPAAHFRPDGSIFTERLSSAGRPAPLVTVAILDPDGGQAPPGRAGEICVRGSLVMAGYYKNPEATAEVSRRGWHHTGDIGYLDDDGFLFIVDRTQDKVHKTEIKERLAGQG
jgi:fatty-acyl-CoA synthase